MIWSPADFAGLVNGLVVTSLPNTATTVAGTMSENEVENPPPTMKTSIALHISRSPLTIRLTRSPLVISTHSPQVHLPANPQGPTRTLSSSGLVPMKFIRKRGLAPIATTSRMAPPAPVAAASYGLGTQGEQWLSILPTKAPWAPGNLNAAASSPGPTSTALGKSFSTFLFKASIALKSIALSVL